MEKEILDEKVMEADSVVKIICAIMNEEEDINAYEGKNPDEIVDLLKNISNRFPDNQQASYDPAYIKFGQAVLNGYGTFGIDFLKQLEKRTDKTISLCFKGMIDLYYNMLIENQELALSQLSEEDRKEIIEDLEKSELTFSFLYKISIIMM